jgi:hypothetical protein
MGGPKAHEELPWNFEPKFAVICYQLSFNRKPKTASISLTLLLAALFGLFAAELPDNAGSPGLAVDAGVGTGLAGVQALLAVVVLHLVAAVMGLPARMKAAFHVPLLPSFL